MNNDKLIMLDNQGVLQRTCVSPLLYVIFVLNINQHLPKDAKYLRYSADLKMYCLIMNNHSH